MILTGRGVLAVTPNEPVTGTGCADVLTTLTFMPESGPAAIADATLRPSPSVTTTADRSAEFRELRTIAPFMRTRLMIRSEMRQ